jgi:uracil-DNA glycosylase
MFNKFGSWKPLVMKNSLAGEVEYLSDQIDILYENTTVYPEKDKIFRVFEECNYDNVSVIILGQDPYHNKYKDVPSACGVAFATENGFINPSLKIIFKELSRSGYSIYGNPVVQGKKLIDWCNQGVLLLNTALTVEEGKPGSHSKLWSRFTNSFIATLSREKRDLVWLLMGKHAQVYKENIISGEVIETVHPMVDVYGAKNVFVGSNVFIQINDILTKKNKTPIDWGCKPEGYE